VGEDVASPSNVRLEVWPRSLAGAILRLSDAAGRCEFFRAGEVKAVSLGLAFFTIAILTVVLFSARYLGSSLLSPWVSQVSALQGVLTITAIVIAVGWYFIDRPHAAKLKFDETINGYGVAGNQALVVAEIAITNTGASAIDLRKSRYSILLQQITPLTMSVVSQLEPKPPAPGAVRIGLGDTWSLVGRHDDQLNAFLETGEVENLYFRALVPCKPDLRIYFTSWFKKPPLFSDWLFGERHEVWIKQTPVDLTVACAPATPKPAAPAVSAGR
jgi:hypothetical protein